MSDNIIFSGKIDTVVDASIPRPQRHRLADEIMISGDHVTLFSLRERIKTARKDVPKLDAEIQIDERKFLFTTRKSIRMFQRIRGEKELIL